MNKVKTLFAIALMCCPVCLLAQTARGQRGDILTARPAGAKALADTPRRNWLSARMKGNNALALTGRLGRKRPASRRPQLLATTGDGTELWGSIVYADSWNEAYWKGEYVPFGYYAFKASADSRFEDLALDEAMQADGGAVILNDTLHLVHDVYGYGSHWVVYSAYDTKSWTLVDQKATGDFGLSAFDLALDPVSGLVYGEFSSTDSGMAGFGTIDFSTLEKEVIPMDTTFVGLAFNSKGVLYGINIDGNLYTIDKLTGAYSLVGATGLKPSAYRQSATFDLSTDKLYFTTQTTDNTSGLYQIDTATGKASLIKMFDDNQEVCGLMVPQRGVTAGSPAMATGLGLTFSEGELSGKVVFTAPTKTMGGASLDGALTYYVVANGDTLASGVTQPGAANSVGVTVAKAGAYRFDVLVRNAAGMSQPCRGKLPWVGFDNPVLTVSRFAIDRDTRRASLSWSVQGAGTHTGYIDHQNITYKVIRYPGAVAVSQGTRESTFEEVLPEGEISLYSYGVIADNHGMASEQAVTAELACGSYRSLPCMEVFGSEGTVGQLFTVLDGNKDNNTWVWDSENGGKAVYNSGNTGVYGDDWLFTPLLKMEPGRTYNLSFVACGKDGNRIQVKFGQGADPTDRNQYKVVVKTTELHNATDTVINKEVEVAEAGYYKFAFHAVSGPNKGKLYLDNVRIEQRSVKGAPGKVSGLAVTPAPKAGLAGAVRFTMPTVTNDGQPLTTDSRVEVRRNTAVIKQLDNLAPGRQIVFLDDAPDNGFNTYTVVPFNGLGEGDRDSVTVFIGQDQPCSVKNLRLTDNLDGTATLAWNAPDTLGVNGGYVDSARVSYKVYYGNYTQFFPDTVLVGKTELEIPIRVEGMQSNLYYNVLAATATGESGLVESNHVVEGEPYALPFAESFPSGNYETLWWRDHATSDNSFRFNLGVSSDNDNGSIYWYPASGSYEGEVCTGKISLSGAKHPQLSFDYFVVPKFDGQWQVSVLENGVREHTVWTLDFSTVDSYDHWEKANVDLSAFRASEFVIVRFKATSHQTDNHGMFLDNVEVKDVNGHDLAVSMTAPKTLRKGKANNVVVSVANKGKFAEQSADVVLRDGGREVARTGCGLLDVSADSAYVFAYVPAVTAGTTADLTAAVELADDENMADNTDEATLRLADNNFAQPVSLTAKRTDGGHVQLTWSAPATLDNVVTDDMEDYASWTVGHIGDWSVFDGDGKQSYGIGSTYFPHTGDPYAFIVFNPGELGLDVNAQAYSNLKPSSGEQCLVCFDAVASKNDDWLVSPVLSGKAQTVSFFAKNIGAVSGNFVEKFNVLYSTGGKEMSDFKLLTAAPVSATDVWTQYAFDLPDGAVRFALQVVSEDQFALMVDDVCYEGQQLRLSGYNVYRDNALVATVPGTSLSYTDAAVAAGAGAVYAVTAVYTAGESRLSEPASVSTGIASVTADGTEARLSYRVDGALARQNRGLLVEKLQSGHTRKVVRK